MFLDSTFFCVRTLRQVSLHLLLTLSSDKLLVGPHLLLSPVCTVVKPAYSVFTHHPNPIQDGEWQCSQLNQSRRHARFVEEHRFDQKRGALFSEILGVAECISATGPKDTVDGSAQDKYPYEVDSNECRPDGRVEGRTGVHVESEVVLKCEGNNNEGACDVLCLM